MNSDTASSVNQSTDVVMPTLTFIANNMTLLIYTNTGRFTIDVCRHDTVGSIKGKIHDREGIPVEQQSLSIRIIGKPLRDELSLSDYDLRDGSSLQLTLRLHKPSDEPTNAVQQSSNAALILETLEFLRQATLDGKLDGVTLRASHIAADVHALTKRVDLGTSVHELASELINDWKTVISAEMQQSQTQEQHSLRDSSQRPRATANPIALSKPDIFLQFDTSKLGIRVRSSEGKVGLFVAAVTEEAPASTKAQVPVGAQIISVNAHNLENTPFDRAVEHFAQLTLPISVRFRPPLHPLTAQRKRHDGDDECEHDHHHHRVVSGGAATSVASKRNQSMFPVIDRVNKSMMCVLPEDADQKGTAVPSLKSQKSWNYSDAAHQPQKTGETYVEMPSMSGGTSSNRLSRHSHRKSESKIDFELDVELGEQEPLKTEICIESNETKTTWTFPRLGSYGSSVFICCRALPMLICLGMGIYALATASDVGYGLIVFGVCFLCVFCVIAMYVAQYGDSTIVFDDDAQMIYMEEKMCCNKRWCACCSSVAELGPYSQFERCFVETHTGEDPEYPNICPPEYTVEFQFKEGENVRNKHTTKGDQRAKMICVAEEINAWWSTQSK